MPPASLQVASAKTVGSAREETSREEPLAFSSGMVAAALIGPPRPASFDPRASEPRARRLQTLCSQLPTFAQSAYIQPLDASSPELADSLKSFNKRLSILATRLVSGGRLAIGVFNIFVLISYSNNFRIIASILTFHRLARTRTSRIQRR